MTLLLVVILVALLFEFINGFHDTANSVAAVVGTRALGPTQAIILAAIMNLAGALAGTAVATTVGKGLVDAHYITSATLICALLGSTTWNIITWRFGLPSSSSHALFGGLIGAALASAGTWDVVIWAEPVAGKPISSWGGLLYKVIIPMFSSPILGFLVAFGWMTVFYLVLARAKPSPVNRVFSRLQIFSSAFMGFSHGSNDAQKTMGILALALFTATKGGDLVNIPSYLHFLRNPEFTIPLWVKLICAVTMAAGTASGGRRIIKTLGRKVTKLQPVQGFGADMTSATVLMTAAHFGMPVSTTHVVSASIMGVGTAKNVSSVKLDLVESILWTWFLTLPASALVAYGVSRALRLMGVDV